MTKEKFESINWKKGIKVELIGRDACHEVVAVNFQSLTVTVDRWGLIDFEYDEIEIIK